MRKSPKYMLYLLLVMIILLLVLRVMGNSHLKITPETVPEIVVNNQTPLAQSIQQILAANQASSSTLFSPLGDPYLALLGRIMLADHASQQLDAQYYLFHDDKAGRALLAAMIEAAQRGVQVRLLMDDMDTKGRDGLFIRLVQEFENFQIRIFNPSWLRSLRGPEYIARFPQVTRRMHNKSYTADAVASIVGGRNIGDEYFNLSSEVNFADFDILAAGKLAADVVGEFNTYWHSGLAFDVQRLNQPANDIHYQQWKKQLATDLQQYRSELKERRDLVVYQLMNRSLRPYFDQGRVIHDPPDKVISSLFDQGENLAPVIMGLMNEAQSELLISSPYFIPGEAGLNLFRQLRERGVKVTILTNALKANDVAMVHAGYRDYRQQLLEMGVEIYELKPQAGSKSDWSFSGSKRVSLHAKTFIVDRHRIFVGSFNLDPRSALHNTEMGIVFDSPEYAEQVYQRVKDKLPLDAYHVVLNSELSLEWHEKRSDDQQRVHHHEPETTWWERSMIYLLSWMPMEWLL